MCDAKNVNGVRDRKIIDHQNEPISEAVLSQERSSCPRGADTGEVQADDERFLLMGIG
jgi:hypothetical protein